MPEPTFDVAAAHRWFAVELNNRAWDLIDQSERSEEEIDRMIHTAHASMWHWLHAGERIHQQRALCLLSCAYAAAGCGTDAVKYAAKCIRMSEEHDAQQTDFDRASAFACAAHAHAVAGNTPEANAARTKAMDIAGKLDEGDRQVVEGMCGPVEPTPASP